MKILKKIMMKENLSVNPMGVKEVCYIAIMACIQMVVFTSFSNILYLECITLTTILFANCFKTRQAVLASIVFGFLNFLVQGIAPWSLMYFLIYPTYSLIAGSLKRIVKDNLFLITILCFIFSFMTGQLVQIPFLLVSKKITLIYLLMGFKTSLFQASLSAFACFFVYRPLAAVLKKIERRLNDEKFI